MIQAGSLSAPLLLTVLVLGLHHDAPGQTTPDLAASRRAGEPGRSSRVVLVTSVGWKVGPAIRVESNAQTDISGTWSASFDTQIGGQDYTYQFQVKEKTLTGKASSALGESDIQNGKVEANKVTFVENLRYQEMTIVIAYTGTIVSPEEIRFTRQVGRFATEEFVARRTQP